MNYLYIEYLHTIQAFHESIFHMLSFYQEIC